MREATVTPLLPHNDLIEAQRVLNLEADALRQLAQNLNESFEYTIDLLIKTHGRVILSGIGKSGHIANKIASTFSSTGTPAFFVHPSEASHGDLGMITPADILIILSLSGDTAELSDMINYAKRFNIPLIAMTRKLDSVLAKAALYTLLLPPSPEACPMGLAPTTSTTLMLALGDALAVALLKRKGFSERDFKKLHPGGRLGHKLLQVQDIMRSYEELPLVLPNTPMSDALVIMTEKGFGCIGVLDNAKKLIGIVTDGDLRRHMSPSLLSQYVAEIMTPSPKTIFASSFAAEALGFMNRSSITNLFVLEESSQALVGLLRLHDCLREGIA
ncbi:MAG: KpsF/GutQ family sugar-phosphate isomerase [Alphaproteobacteria bacterium]|nr:KpsF/GutQ family sugar-phosphate isomerase [Alphaproteobacteria bacterium]